jgi:hypothetical protein
MADKIITDLTLADEFSVDLNFPVDDTIQTYRLTGQQLLDFLKPSYQKSQGLLKNVGLQATASAGALTVALKQADGTTNPLAGDVNLTEIAFRADPITVGGQALVEFDAALSLVIPSTATLGQVSGANARVFVYAYYDGTDKGLAVAARLLDEDQLWSTTAIGTGSDSVDGIYADDIYTDASLRLIGEVQINPITTAGTWTSPTRVTPFQFLVPPSGLLRTTNFDVSGSFLKSPLTRYVEVELVGGGAGGGAATGSPGGGGGGGAGGYSFKRILASSLAVSETVTIGANGTGGNTGAGTGTNGGTTSFGAHCSATGGTGGQSDTGGFQGGAGGAGSSGDLNRQGQAGGSGATTGTPYGFGGSSEFGYGGFITGGGAGNNGIGYGNGGSAGYANSATDRDGGDGRGGFVTIREYA